MSNVITSADAVFTLTIDQLFSNGFRVQGFAVGDMFSTGEISPVETQMGADGVLAGGWVPVARAMRIALQASSKSIANFELWASTQDQQRTILNATGLIILNSTQTKYNLINGYLSGVSPMPDAKRVLEPRIWGITWENITPAPQ